MFTRDKNAKAGTAPLSESGPVTTILPPTSADKPSASPDKNGHGVARAATATPAVSPVSLRDLKGDVRPEPRSDAAKGETKRLIVGRGISMDGKISSCDRLIVDGKVQAELEDCHTIEITENGNFKGAAEITSAEISGHYDGSLTVRESLLIRGTGRVSGTVRYGRLHIEDGGEINGDVKSLATK